MKNSILCQFAPSFGGIAEPYMVAMPFPPNQSQSFYAGCSSPPVALVALFCLTSTTWRGSFALQDIGSSAMHMVDIRFLGEILPSLPHRFCWKSGSFSEAGQLLLYQQTLKESSVAQLKQASQHTNMDMICLALYSLSTGADLLYMKIYKACH